MRSYNRFIILGMAMLGVLGRLAFAPEIGLADENAANPANPSDPFSAAIVEGDRAWIARAEALEEDRDPALAKAPQIEASIRAFRSALEALPESLEARWKLLRSLHYAVEFTTLPESEKDTLVAQAVELAGSPKGGNESNESESDIGPSDADRARVLFWSAIAWGTRGQRVGLLTIVREGVATRMHDDAEASLELDPSVDEGGALRLLSRLHATLPRVPFVSGWVDRARALPLAEAAYDQAPGHPGNRLILALALLERAPDRLDEARELLKSVAESTPRSEYVVEDLAIRHQAQTELGKLDSDS